MKLFQDYSLNSLSASLYGNYRDNWLGGGINTLSLGLTSGNLSDDKADQQSRSDDGSFNKLRYSASRTQIISSHHTVLIKVAGQFGEDRLDTSQSFYLGGVDGVRGLSQ